MQTTVPSLGEVANAHEGLTRVHIAMSKLPEEKERQIELMNLAQESLEKALNIREGNTNHGLDNKDLDRVRDMQHDLDQVRDRSILERATRHRWLTLGRNLPYAVSLARPSAPGSPLPVRLSRIPSGGSRGSNMWSRFSRGSSIEPPKTPPATPVHSADPYLAAADADAEPVPVRHLETV